MLRWFATFALTSGTLWLANGLALTQDAPTLAKQNRWVTSAAFIKEGSELVTAGGESLLYRPGDLKIWNVKGGNEVASLEGQPTTIWSVAAAPDGKTIITSGYDGKIILWNAADKKPEQIIEAKVPHGKDETLNVIVVARQYNDPEPPAFDLMPGADIHKIRDQLRSGNVIIGSVLSQKTGLKIGDKLPLETKEGVKEFPICAVANEYMVGGLAVHMARSYATEWLGVQGVDGYIVKLQPGADAAAIRTRLAAICKQFDVILMSRLDIKAKVQQFVSGAEWSLWLLVMMGFVVGAFGVVNTLTMNVLEQTRELGLLRIVAMTKRQVRRTILMQALIIGGVGLPPGILLGIGVAYVINLAMMPSFGHPVEFNLHPELLLGTLAGALVIVLLAALIPARRATQINVVEALHYE